MTSARIAILGGAGFVGPFIAYELSRDFEVWVVDISEEKLAKLKGIAHTVKLDATNIGALGDFIKNFDIVVDALPGSISFPVYRTLIMTGCNIVDISSMYEDPLILHEEAVKRGVKVVVDVGFDPGLSNMLVGHIYSVLGPLDEVIIHVGSLPKVPKPPLYHKAFWSIYDLLSEYIEPVPCMIDGRIVTLDPLEHVGTAQIGGFNFEKYPSSGLRTLLKTIKAKNIVEYTVRWPGHIERMKLLRELGFFKKEFINFTVKVLLPALQYESPDMCVLEVYGKAGNKAIRYYVYDEEREGFSATTRLTGSMAAYIVRLMAKGKIEEPGVTPPEYLGMRSEILEYVLRELKAKGVIIRSSEEHVE